MDIPQIFCTNVTVHSKAPSDRIDDVHHFSPHLRKERERERGHMQGQGHHVQTGYPVAGAGGAGGAGGGYYPTPPDNTNYYVPPPSAPVHHQQQQQQQQSGGTSLLSAAANIGAKLGAAAIGAATTASRGGGSTGTATAAPAVMQMHAAQMQQHAVPRHPQPQAQPVGGQFPLGQQFQQVLQHTGLAPPVTPPVPPTCWCGFKDDPECNPCVRGVCKVVLFPVAAAAWPLGAALWAALQSYYCLFSCCMMSHVTRLTASPGGQGGGIGVVQPQRDVISCWECQAKAWVACDKFNGRCWVCELPTSKRVLKGHVVEAPCQLCLWGEN